MPEIDLTAADSMIAYWLLFTFVIGAVVGSFLNVAIARLPLEKSLLWPGSRCGACHRPVRWYHNLPLVSYLWLHGRCSDCGARYSVVYFLVELATALGFAGLFYLEVVVNVHGWPRGPIADRGFFPWWAWAGFGYHALLFALLLAASVCDLKSREIPLQLTLTGTVIGLIGAVLMPWPWPWEPAQATPQPRLGQAAEIVWQTPNAGRSGTELRQGVYPWPVWGPLPEPLAPGGNWQTGLATGLAGALVGTLLLRAVGFLFGTGLGKEALGLGDADLMMMAGAFLGWQVVVVAFLLSVFPALLFGFLQLVIRNDNSLPYGPSLSLGILGTYLGWTWIGALDQVRLPFFWGTLLFWVVVAGGGLLFLMAFAMRLLQREPAGADGGPNPPRENPGA